MYGCKRENEIISETSGWTRPCHVIYSHVIYNEGKYNMLDTSEYSMPSDFLY